jgi:hypothetical protein
VVLLVVATVIVKEDLCDVVLNYITFKHDDERAKINPDTTVRRGMRRLLVVRGLVKLSIVV